ncbi:MAG: hypothetical protein WC505_07240 [Patescibacteria group bacterium]
MVVRPNKTTKYFAGINTMESSIIPDMDSPECANGIVDKPIGELKKRDGCRRITNTALAGPVDGIAFFQRKGRIIPITSSYGCLYTHEWYDPETGKYITGYTFNDLSQYIFSTAGSWPADVPVGGNSQDVADYFDVTLSQYTNIADNAAFTMTVTAKLRATGAVVAAYARSCKIRVLRGTGKLGVVSIAGGDWVAGVATLATQKYNANGRAEVVTFKVEENINPAVFGGGNFEMNANTAAALTDVTGVYYSDDHTALAGATYLYGAHNRAPGSFYYYIWKDGQSEALTAQMLPVLGRMRAAAGVGLLSSFSPQIPIPTITWFPAHTITDIDHAEPLFVAEKGGWKIEYKFFSLDNPAGSWAHSAVLRTLNNTNGHDLTIQKV